MKAFVLALTVATLGGPAFAQEAVTFGKCAVEIDTESGTLLYDADYASTPAQRARGLMFREDMAPRTGMLFRFDDDRPVAMWMKNTLLPLDMVFITPEGTIGTIHRDAVPKSLTVIPSRVPARHVLELNAGEAGADGLQPGQAVRVLCEQ